MTLTTPAPIAFHRIFLQHLQSGVPGQWLLKSPAHLWQLDALFAEYPDALIVQTHRDPLNVISSIAALTNHLRRMGSDESDIAECAVQSYEEIVVGLEREMALRDGGGVPADQVIDVHYAISSTTPGPRSAASTRNWAASCDPTPNSGCETFWPLIPETAAAVATRGRTPDWTPPRFVTGCGPTRSATRYRPSNCGDRENHPRMNYVISQKT